MPESHTSLSMLETLGFQAKTLVVELDDTFPPLNPNPTDSIEQIMFRAGQRSVVDWIKQYMED